MRGVLRTGTFILALWLSSGSAQAQSRDLGFGLRGGLYFDEGDLFLGGHGLLPLRAGWTAVPNLEMGLGDGTLFTVNGDFTHGIARSRGRFFYAGGGLAIIHHESSGKFRDGHSDTDLGLNLLGGVNFGQAPGFIPFAQLKIILSDNANVVFSGGIHFF